MTNADLMTTQAAVKLPNGTVLQVDLFDLEGENRILRELGRRLYETYGPGGYAANCRGLLEFWQSAGQAAAYQQAVSEIVRLTATKARPGVDAVFEFRETPEGLAAELFLRTRRTAPDLAEAVILTQVNEASAPDIARQLFAGLSEDSKRRSARANPAPA